MMLKKAFKKIPITQSNTTFRSRLAISNEKYQHLLKEKELYKVCQEKGIV
jgi:hypothetical protein